MFDIIESILLCLKFAIIGDNIIISPPHQASVYSSTLLNTLRSLKK